MSHGPGFDREGFAAAVQAVIEARGLSDRAAGREAGVGPATVSRLVRQGQTVEVHALALLADWAGLPVDAFIVRRWPLPATPLVADTRRIVAAQHAARAAAEALALVLANGEAP